MSGHTTLGKSLLEAFSRCEGKDFILSAPSKVNVRLKVVGRRADGYHLLSMLNFSTSLADRVTISFERSLSPEVSLSPEGSVPLGGENLVTKAWRAFWSQFLEGQPEFGFRCHIEKRIPVGGGLGGGSADAGAMFKVLSHCFGDVLRHSLGLSEGLFAEKLNAAALCVGADVPYALHGGACVVTGIGEVIRPLATQAVWPGKVVLMVPPVPVATLAFYDQFRKARPVVPDISDSALEGFVSSGKGEIPSLVENDFEQVVGDMVPVIRQGLQVAREVVPVGTALTGSGSVFFSLLKEGEEGLFEELKARLQPLGVVCYLSDIVSPQKIGIS